MVSRNFVATSVFVELRAMDARFCALGPGWIGVRVADRTALVARVTDWGKAVRAVVAVREVVLVVARGETSRTVVLRDAVDRLFFARGVVVRSREGCVCLLVAFVMREMAFVLDAVAGVFDF